MTAQRDWHSEPEQPETIEIGWPNLGLHDKAGPLRLTLATLGGLIILGVVLYGLNRPHPRTSGACRRATRPRSHQRRQRQAASRRQRHRPRGSKAIAACVAVIVS